MVGDAWEGLGEKNGNGKVPRRSETMLKTGGGNFIRLQCSSRTLAKANAASESFVALFRVVRGKIGFPMAYPGAAPAS